MSAGSSAPGYETRRTKRALFGFAALASVVLVAVCLVALVILVNDEALMRIRESIVSLNEIRAQVADVTANAALASANAALASAQETLRGAAEERLRLPILLVVGLCAVSLVAVWAITTYLYVSVIRPFMRLEVFADEVSRGNLDLPLVYERSNPFGRFTWAFDNMRKELKRARAAEALAVEQSKTTAAALSHDVKTPIASIRAYSEALSMGVARTEEERSGYVSTIIRKCDEVAQITDDLFLHALADLDRIVVVCEPAPIQVAIRRAVNDFDATGKVSLVRLDEAVLLIDVKRLAQVIENLLANARKYAPDSTVEVRGVQDNGTYRIVVRDFGTGISPEDMPFAFDRFYRGANANNAAGAGLGLFIVRYLTEQMGGTVQLENVSPGLQVTINLPIAS